MQAPCPGTSQHSRAPYHSRGALQRLMEPSAGKRVCQGTEDSLGTSGILILDSAGKAWPSCFMGTQRDMRCWEPGGCPGLPVCWGARQGHGACQARARSSAPALRKAYGKLREESESERGEAHSPTGSISSSCRGTGEVAQGSQLLQPWPSCSQLAHTTQCKRCRPSRSPREGHCQGLPLPTMVTWGSQLQQP